jgi:hypothetical protein
MFEKSRLIKNYHKTAIKSGDAMCFNNWFVGDYNNVIRYKCH